MARIIDISDETNPTTVSRLMLEIHAAKSCPMVLPDIVGLAIFTYGSHYCSVDNKRNATTLACGYFNAGIRVFDIPAPVAEIDAANGPRCRAAELVREHYLDQLRPDDRCRRRQPELLLVRKLRLLCCPR